MAYLYQIYENFRKKDLTVISLRGNCTPNQIWACFMHCLKIVNTFLKNNVWILKQILEKVTRGVQISEGHVVLELLINMYKTLFWSIPQEPLGLLKLECDVWVSQTIYLRMFICDMIKGNESDVRNIDFELQATRGNKFLCFTLFLNLKNCSYLWNQMSDCDRGWIKV